MALSYQELSAVADALRPRLVGGQLQRVRQPSGDRLLLSVRGRQAEMGPLGVERPAPGPGATWELLICVEPPVARVHTTQRSWTLPPSPLGFTQRLRAEVLNGFVADVALPWPDRVLAMTIRRGDVAFQIIVELTGHHANAFLTGADGTILASMRPTTSRRRDLRPGHLYVPPLPPDGVDPTRAKIRHDGPVPSLFGDALLRSLDERYAAAEAHRELSLHLSGLRRRVRKQVTRLERLRNKIDIDLARARDADRLRHYGELLKTQLSEAHRGDTVVRLVDWSDPDGPRVEVPLSPELSPGENLARLFSRYRKLRRATRRVETRLRDTEERLLVAMELAEKLDAVTLPDEQTLTEQAVATARVELDAVDARAQAAGIPAGPRHSPGKRSKGPQRRLPFRTYHALDGTALLVGRGGADNGALTFRHARDNDVWLHVRGGAGAHVIVRRRQREPVSRETLIDAALLAVHFSKRRGDTMVDVHMTPRRLVRPLRGAPSGTVRVERSETLTVRHDPERLARVLATRVPAPSTAGVVPGRSSGAAQR